MNIVGIDPGVTGALALFRDGTLADVEDMPVFDGRADGSWIGHYLEQWEAEVVYLEWAQPMPKNGSIASFSLGLNSGDRDRCRADLGVAARAGATVGVEVGDGVAGQTEGGVAGDGDRVVAEVRSHVSPGEG